MTENPWKFWIKIERLLTTNCKVTRKWLKILDNSECKLTDNSEWRLTDWRLPTNNW